MITSLGNYIYSSDENTVYTHLYIGSNAKVEVGGKTVTISQEALMPWEGKSTFTLSRGEYTLAVRIPSWADKFTVTVNGKEVKFEEKKGYAYISANWNEGDKVVVLMPLEVKLVEANPLVRADGGKVAISRGPVVYCLESKDNGDRLSSVRLDTDGEFRCEKDDELFPGSISIYAKALKKKAWDTEDLYRAFSASFEEVEIKAIPYAFWGNRDDNREMAVWVRY